MELGERIKQARLEAGLSQRQLCGDVITRNMLSLIENGSARPSMDTLRYLAQRLGKSIGYFLEEETVTSPNQACMDRARKLWASSDALGVVEALGAFTHPDETFENEQGLLLFLAKLSLARQAIQDGRIPYARTLLAQAGQLRSIYLIPALQQQRQLLLAQAGLEARLDDDEILLLRAQAALDRGDPARCLEILAAAQDTDQPRWQLLFGMAAFRQDCYRDALVHLRAAEAVFPRETVSALEICCRELGDFQNAYAYACKAREQQ